MYDAVTPSLIPDGPLLAGYINGRYQSYYQIAADHPHADVLTITVKAHNSDGSYVIADILDIESGDATPAEAPGWAVAMRALNRPIITNYCSRLATWPATKLAFAKAGILPPDFWIADYTGQPHLVPGSVATQWTDFKNLYDISMTNGTWPLSPTPPPPPPPPPLIAPPIQTYPVGKYIMNLVGVPTDPNGNGWIPTNIPFATFAAATIQGSDPSPDVDNAYWPGTCKVQNRDGKVLVSVVGCLPKIVQNVFVLTSS